MFNIMVLHYLPNLKYINIYKIIFKSKIKKLTKFVRQNKKLSEIKVTQELQH